MKILLSSSSSSSPFSARTVFEYHFPVMIFFLLFVSPSSSSQLNSQKISSTAYYHQKNFHHSCSTFKTGTSAAICYQLQRIRHCPPFQPPPAPPSAAAAEIDPRYGVEKRLVPSGPNPLHN